MNALGSRAPIALEKRVLRRRKQAEEAKHPFPTVLTFFFTAPSIFVSNFPLKGKGRQSFRDLHAESGVARYGSMAKRAPREAKTEVARVWQQRSTRAAILEAARRLAVHEDVSNLSLAKVADEANFSPNTVYAYFVNKSELMIAVVADDLAALAREMRDVFPANEDMEADAPPQTEDDAQGEEQGQSEPVEAAMEDTRDAMDASLPPESVSEITPRETEDLPVVATVGTIDEVSHGPEPQSVSESVEAAPVAGRRSGPRTKRRNRRRAACTGRAACAGFESRGGRARRAGSARICRRKIGSIRGIAHAAGAEEMGAAFGSRCARTQGVRNRRT
jgi:AcrR family transcriptional regulator